MAEHFECILPFVSECEGQVYTAVRKYSTSENCHIIDKLVSKISSSGMSKGKKNEIELLYQRIKNLEANCIRNQIILNAAQSTCAEKKNATLAVQKMSHVIATKELTSLATVNKDENVNVPLYWLGIKIPKSPELNVQEKMEIRSLVEANILLKGNKVKNSFSNNAISKRKINTKRQEIQDILTGIRNNIPVYNTEVCKYVHTIKEVLNHRERIYSADSNNQKWLHLKAEYLELKARLLHYKYLYFFYTEDPKIIEALAMLHECLKVELEDLKPELNKFVDVTKAYAKLKGTEYDNILYQYLNALKMIKEKKKTLQRITHSK